MTLPPFQHTPVLLQEVLHWLDPQPGQRILDLTVGGAGHACAIASHLGPTGHLIGLDQDPTALAIAQQRLHNAPCQVDLVPANFRNVLAAIAPLGIKPWTPSDPNSGVSALLADLGASSPQFDSPERGFSFQHNGPLDMRMSDQGPTAATLLQSCSTEDLTHWLHHWGDVPRARTLARRIKEAAAANNLNDTASLRRLVESVLGNKKHKTHPATTVFQAIRIAVNDEMTALDTLLDTFLDLLRPNGLAAFISFHSGEDRRVKTRLRSLQNPCRCPIELPVCCCGLLPRGQVLTPRAVIASASEQADNPRSRSAKLRVFRATPSINPAT